MDDDVTLELRTTTPLVVAALVLASISGVGLVAAEDFPSATDGKIANGEELKTAEDNDDQVYAINYTFSLQNHQPGHVDGAVEHYAVGLTENGTLHRIKLYSEDFGFSNCEPDNTAAFGIDRGNNENGTATDRSLLTSFKSYDSQEDYIDIKYYKEETLAGEPVRGSVHDQIVAAQNNCYDNPSEPGWYRINGTITGHVDSDDGDATDTDYKIRDLSQWIYICDCSSRAEAEETLGPPPSESDSGTGDGNSDGGGGATATATATPTPDSDGSTGDGGSTPTATPTMTATATATPTPSTGGGGGGGSAATATATPTSSGGGGGSAATATATSTPSTGGSSAAATATATPAGGGAGSAGSSAPMTPTVGSGPGFGAVAALGGLLAAGLLARRRD